MTAASGRVVRPILQVAVLTDAVATFRRLDGIENPRARRLFAEAEAWFASDEADGPFTFVTVCDSLGLDPSYIRRGLSEDDRGSVAQLLFLEQDQAGLDKLLGPLRLLA